MANVCTLNELEQGRLREDSDRKAYAFFLDIHKAYCVTCWFMAYIVGYGSKREDVTSGVIKKMHTFIVGYLEVEEYI